MNFVKKIYLILIGTILVHLAILSKLQFTAWPEMLSFPYMIDKGFLIYKDFHHVYQPLLTFTLSIYYKFAGYSPESLKVFTWILISLIDLMIFLTSRQLFKNKWFSLIPLGLYVILQPLFEGNMLWPDIAMAPPILLSVYFILRWASKKKNIFIFLSALFLSMGFLVKQQAALAFVPLLIYLWIKKATLKEFLFFVAGAGTPLIVLLVYLISSGNLKDYLFWTFRVPLFWYPKIPGFKILPTHKELLIIILMITTPLPGILAGLRDKSIDVRKILIYAMFLALLSPAFPRFSFFHLQPALAFFVIVAGYSFQYINIPALLVISLSFFYIVFYRCRLVLPEFKGGIRFYGADEIHLSQYISSVTAPGDKIYFLGPASSVYVYANRIPPKPWIENYVWYFEIPGLQEKVIAGWKSDPPKIIFWTPSESGNWFDLGTYQPKKIVEWIKNNYIEKGETKSGIEVWYLKSK